VDGVVAVSILTGAAASDPSLEMAIPCGRPFSHSSICDSVQTLVPCARQVRETEQSRKERLTTRKDMWFKSKAGAPLRPRPVEPDHYFRCIGMIRYYVMETE
jgi:hypothetical protein